MVRFRVDVTNPTGNDIKHVGDILEVADEHVDAWAEYEDAGYVVRLPEDSDEPAPGTFDPPPPEEPTAEHDTVTAADEQ
jgi:hypothetical protein